MTNPTQVESIVAGLSEAQRRDILLGNCAYAFDSGLTCLCASKELDALIAKGLVKPLRYTTGRLLTNAGAAVRKALEDAGR